jgi:hypothetical protein
MASKSKRINNEGPLGHVYFGGDSTEDVNWRERLRYEDDIDDDEPLKETPLDVIGMLGFDPLDIDDDGNVKGDEVLPKPPDIDLG